MSSSSGPPTVLVVEDEQDVAAVYAVYLSESYEVRTAHSGEEAVEAFDESVDAVLLDRRMPEMSGDEVLDWIRAHDFEVPVAMVTAVDPGIDSAEMRYDDYLVKPVERDQLVETVGYLLELEAYDEAERELQSTRLRKNILERKNPLDDLEQSDPYQRLRSKAEALEAKMNDARSPGLDDEEIDRRLDRSETVADSPSRRIATAETDQSERVDELGEALEDSDDHREDPTQVVDQSLWELTDEESEERSGEASVGRVESYRGIVDLQRALSVAALGEMIRHDVAAETEDGQRYDPAEILKLKALTDADREDAVGQLYTSGAVDVAASGYPLDPAFFAEGDHDVDVATFAEVTGVDDARERAKLGAVAPEDRDEAEMELAEMGTVTPEWYDVRGDRTDALDGLGE